MSAKPIDRTDLSRLVWCAALAAERGDPMAAAEIFEEVAQRLRGKEVSEPQPARLGNSRQSGTGSGVRRSSRLTLQHLTLGEPHVSKANEKHIGRRALLKCAALSTIATTLPTLPALALGGDDHALIETEAEITRLYAWLDANPDADEELERDPVYEQIYPLEDFIALAPARSLADVAVKLRRMLDREVGINTGSGVNDVPTLLSIHSFVRGVLGEPTHPTRPLSTLDDCKEEEGA